MSTDRRFLVHRAGDVTRDGVVRNIHTLIDSLDVAKVWRVEVREYTKPRTSEANRYLWGVVYACLTAELGFTAEEWHEEMCIRHFGKVEVVKPGGRIETKPLRTTTTDEHGKRDVLGGRKFWDFIDRVCKEAANAGVYVPEPNEGARAA